MDIHAFHTFEVIDEVIEVIEKLGNSEVAKPGIKVKYIGASDEQVNWGSNDDPRDLLVDGGIYTIESVEVHSWHTKYYLKEFPGKKFNSVSFEKEVINK